MPSVKAELIIEARNQAGPGANAAAAALKNVTKQTAEVNKAAGGLGKSLGGLSQQFLGVNLATVGFVGAAGLVVVGMRKAIDATVDYAASVRDLSRDMGVSAEEASTLIQIGDDLKVSYDTLKMAAREMNKDGIQPNLVNIKLLAAEYQALKTPVEQAQFATDHFGRSAAEMRKVLESTPAALDKMAKSARDAGLVMSEQDVKAAREFEMATDDLQDAWQGLVYTLGNKAIPALTAVATAISNTDKVRRLLIEANNKDVLSQKEINAISFKVQQGIITQAQAINLLEGAMQGTNTEAEKYAHMQGVVKEATDAATLGVMGYIKAHQNLKGAWQEEIDLSGAVAAGLSGTLTKAQDEYNQVVAETQPEIEKLVKEIARMNAAQGKTWTVTTAATASVEEYQLAQLRAAVAQQKANEATNDGSEDYLELVVASQRAAENVTKLGGELGMTETFTANYTKKLIEANAGLGELEGKLATAEEALRRTTNEFIFQQLAVEGDWKANLELARTLGIMDEASYSAAVVLGKLKEEYLKTGDLDKYTEKTKAAADAIARLQDKHITITETHIYEEIHTGSGSQWSSNENRGQYGGGFASGANFVVPPGFPNDSYPMRVQSGEHVQVTPAGQAPSNGPTIGTVNVYGTTDPAETARLVGREIAGQLRRAMSGGVGAIGR